jgi:hypothetical protein
MKDGVFMHTPVACTVYFLLIGYMGRDWWSSAGKERCKYFQKETCPEVKDNF